MRKRSSPKSLVSTTPAPPEQGSLGLEQTGPPNSYSFKGPDFGKELQKVIEWWRQFAKAHIEAGAASDDVLDRTAAANEVLKRLDLIEAHGRNDRAAFYLYQGMLLASRVHQLAIVDNEAPISQHAEKLESFSKGRMEHNARSKAKADREHKKWQDEADRLQEGRQRPMSATALAKKVKAGLGLKEEEGTIRKVLKKPGMSH